MKPIYARQPNQEEYKALRNSLKSADGFRVRRAQMILMSAVDKLPVAVIAERLNCHGQTVRKAIHAFHEHGLNCLEASSRARLDDQRAFSDKARRALRELICHNPREFGYETSLWTLAILAEVSFAQGLTAHLVHGETVRTTLADMGIAWRRAKQWINSPDPHYATKKKTRLAEDPS